MAGRRLDEALRRTKASGLAGMDLAKVVSTPKPYEWSEGGWELGKGYRRVENPKFHVVAYELRHQRNILRLLADRSMRVTVVPRRPPPGRC